VLNNERAAMPFGGFLCGLPASMGYGCITNGLLFHEFLLYRWLEMGWNATSFAICTASCNVNAPLNYSFFTSTSFVDFGFWILTDFAYSQLCMRPAD
jgi:hypothetical protein